MVQEKSISSISIEDENTGTVIIKGEDNGEDKRVQSELEKFVK